jgi:hypothetical protein
MPIPNYQTLSGAPGAEFGVQLEELFKVRDMTPREGLIRTLFPWFSSVWCWCRGVGLLRHAKLVSFSMLLVFGMEALPSRVVTLIVGVVVVGTVREVVVTCGQEMPHGPWMTEPREA